MDHSTILMPDMAEVEIAPVSQCDLRVGAVSYLNTKPIVFGLKALAPRLRVEIAPPSQLARRLHGGHLDVALVPVLEYFSQPDYGLIPESAICGNGRVRSVLLFSRVPMEQVRSVCLDPESITSNTLLKVLYRERRFTEPQWMTRSPQTNPSDVLKTGQCDAVLVIGNRALSMSNHHPFEYDLGQEWWRLTGLPFVFAVWASRPGVETGDLPDVLRTSKQLGVENLEWIATDASRTLGLDRALCLTYLQRMIQYDLNERARQGMNRFFELCSAIKSENLTSSGTILRR